MPARRRFCLTEVVGEGSNAEPRSLDVGDKRAVIGRSEAADLSVLVPTVSRRHAEVWIDEAGATIKDLRSGHGTFINGVRISKETVLRQGDLVSLGHDLVFLVSASESSEMESLEDAALAREAPVDSSLVELALSQPNDDKRKGYMQALAGLLEQAAEATDVGALTRCAVETLASVMSADRTLVLLGSDADNLVTSARKLSVDSNEGLDQPPSRSILKRAMVSDKAVITFDAQTDQRFRKRGSIAMSNIRSAICVGLTIDDGIIGVLYADNQVAAGLFSMPDGHFMQMVARAVALHLRQLRTAALFEQQAATIADFQRARESLVAGLAGDVRSHLNRLEMIADDLEHEHQLRAAAALLRAEAKRFASDVDSVVAWQTRESTAPGVEDAPLTPPLEDSAVRRSSEVYDELDPEGGSLPKEAPRPELPAGSALAPPPSAPPSADEEARARKRAEVLATAANVAAPRRRSFAPTPPPEESNVLSVNKPRKLTGPQASVEGRETRGEEREERGGQGGDESGEHAGAAPPPTPTPALGGDATADGDDSSNSGNDLPPAPSKPRLL